jgi:hypothetical protein
MEGLVVVEGVYEGDDNLCSNINITLFKKIFYILPTLWPPIISRH